MSDKKISQLPNASTPLDGTEQLPIVQSGNTVKAMVKDINNIGPIISVDLSTSDYTIPGPGAYIIQTLGIGNLIFPDPSLTPGGTIIVDCTRVNNAAYVNNTNNFSPYNGFNNQLLGMGNGTYTVYSMGDRWVGGSNG